MSTPNFYSKAGTVYAVEVGEDDDYIIEDTQANILAELADHKSVGICPEDSWDDDLRSYPGRIFAAVTNRKARIDLWAEAKLITRSGYYADANLDFALAIYDSYAGEYYLPDELDARDIAESVAAHRGRACSAAEAARIQRRLIRDMLTIQKAIEKVYSAYTTPLKRVATFSNGEALYELKQPA